MNKENFRLKIIEKCLDKKLSRFEADRILISHGYNKLKEKESDCYDIMLESTKSLSNSRERVIAYCIIHSFSKTDANIALYDAKFRHLNEQESVNYDDVISRIRYSGQPFKFPVEKKKKENKISVQEIIKNGILNEYKIDEVNTVLLKSGYAELTDAQSVEYRKKYNEYHNKRQSIIQHAFEDLKSVQEVNTLLQACNYSSLTMVEEFNYLKEKERIFEKKRINLIKECIEERFQVHEIESMLNKNGFEPLSQQEKDKIITALYGVGQQVERKPFELSQQFRNLYRKATKQFHPDRFSDTDKKNQANIIMKELNEAKEKNDYFLLKEIVKKYETILY